MEISWGFNIWMGDFWGFKPTGSWGSSFSRPFSSRFFSCVDKRCIVRKEWPKLACGRYRADLWPSYLREMLCRDGKQTWTWRAIPIRGEISNEFCQVATLQKLDVSSRLVRSNKVWLFRRQTPLLWTKLASCTKACALEITRTLKIQIGQILRYV